MFDFRVLFQLAILGRNRRILFCLSKANLLLLITHCFWAASTPVHAEEITDGGKVILDGSLGPAMTLQGPEFIISPELGKQQGNNLFHSFSELYLNKEGSITFTGPDNIHNIIGRVTGGKASEIDGTIRSTIPQANLYLLNPYGFVLGRYAKLDVSGSFYLSTATKLYFKDNGLFDTRPDANSTLVSASPMAFGFLDNMPNRIQIRGSELVTTKGNKLALYSGEIQLDSARLTANSGRVSLTTVLTSKQLIPLEEEISLKNEEHLGKVFLENRASLDVGTQGAGDIYIRSGELNLDSSDILANTQGGDNRAGSINIAVERLNLTNRANIDNRMRGPGQGGSIRISAMDSVELLDSNILTTSLALDPEAEDTGDTGNITLSAKELKLSNSTISTATYSRGKGGDIDINVSRSITLDSVPKLLISSSSIQASSLSTKEDAGNAGRISINTRSLQLTGSGSKIDNSTFGAGQGGSVFINAINLLNLADDSFISSDSRGTGNAGSIIVNTGVLALNNASISTAADKAEGGNIIINVGRQVQLQNSAISATVNGGLGNGGNLVIGSPRFLNLEHSQIIANASGGNGGKILLISGNALKTVVSVIEASSETGLDGEVKIDLPNISIESLPTDFLDMSNLIRKRCVAKIDGELSTLLLTGRDSSPSSPEDLHRYIPTFEELERSLHP